MYTIGNFVNSFGIVAVAFVSLFCIVFSGSLKPLAEHINNISSFKLGKTWQIVITGTTIMLGYMLVSELIKVINEGYEGYPNWFLGIFGYGMSIALIIIAGVLSLFKWKQEK